jgi:hypothetical protein
VSEIAGVILVDGRDTGERVKVDGTVIIGNIPTGETEIAVRSVAGAITKAPAKP